MTNILGESIKGKVLQVLVKWVIATTLSMKEAFNKETIIQKWTCSCLQFDCLKNLRYINMPQQIKFNLCGHASQIEYCISKVIQKKCWCGILFIQWFDGFFWLSGNWLHPRQLWILVMTRGAGNDGLYLTRWYGVLCCTFRDKIVSKSTRTTLQSKWLVNSVIIGPVMTIKPRLTIKKPNLKLMGCSHLLIVGIF